MPKFLSIANKLLSLRGNIRITDENDNLVFEARGEFALFSATWRIFQNGTQVASIRRKVFAITPTYTIRGGLGEFTIKRKIFAFTRQMYVLGGPYDGARIAGNIWDLRFSVEGHKGVIAKAAGKILTLRDRHNVELQTQDANDALFVVIAMVTLQIERQHEKNKRDE